MGVVISFSDRPKEIWLGAGWAFRQIRDDVLSQFPNDHKIAEQFELAELHAGLPVYDLEPELAAKITNAIRQVATDILAGNIQSGILDGREGDPNVLDKEYRKGLQSLLDVISEAEKHR